MRSKRVFVAIIFILILGPRTSFSQSQPATKPDSKGMGAASTAPSAADVPGAQSPASTPELSPQQRADIAEVLSEAKENGEMVARRLASNAKRFDEVVLADRIDEALERRCVDGIKAAVYDAAVFRLEAALQVVHLLTPEQRRYLKAEMAKPDSERGILEAVAKVFYLKIEDRD